MHPSIRTFDRSDLILAWLGRRKYSNAHVDLWNYHDAVQKAFTKSFGIDLDLAPVKSPIPDDGGLHGLFVRVVATYEETRSPFTNYMCGTREISEFYQKYNESLLKAESSLRSLHMTMLVELVERIWGSGAPHRVSQQELEACGHPGWNAPDPVDYW